ncbi:MAG: hypothetical protein IT516_12430 [Burkholderiales bacterium]|nr:hypothetical protein [Burkholderiales bacterium]
MKEQTKTTRVRVLRPFYLSRDRIAKVGDEVDIETGLAGGLVSGRKAELLTETHKPVPTPAATPAPAKQPAPTVAAPSAMKGKP